MVNGRDLTLPKRTQTSEQEYSDLTTVVVTRVPLHKKQ